MFATSAVTIGAAEGTSDALGGSVVALAILESSPLDFEAASVKGLVEATACDDREPPPSAPELPPPSTPLAVPLPWKSTERVPCADVRARSRAS